MYGATVEEISQEIYRNRTVCWCRARPALPGNRCRC